MTPKQKQDFKKIIDEEILTLSEEIAKIKAANTITFLEEYKKFFPYSK